MLENISKIYYINELKNKNKARGYMIESIIIDAVDNNKKLIAEDGEELTPQKVRKIIDSL